MPGERSAFARREAGVAPQELGGRREDRESSETRILANKTSRFVPSGFVVGSVVETGEPKKRRCERLAVRCLFIRCAAAWCFGGEVLVGRSRQTIYHDDVVSQPRPAREVVVPCDGQLSVGRLERFRLGESATSVSKRG
jgi:hypothetical protein